MITVASHQTRTILGRLEKGADLIQGLLEVCRARKVRCGTVSVLGALETVELTHYDTKNKRYRPSRILAGPFEILSVVGNLSERKGEMALHLHITVSREGDNGIDVLGGHVLSGKVFACEFAITALDDVLLRRGSDRSTGLPLWKEGFEADAESAATPDKTSATKAPAPSKSEAASAPDGESPEKTTWDEVAAASAATQPPSAPGESAPSAPPTAAGGAAEPEDEEDDQGDEGEEDGDYIDLSPGDIIEHPRFGACKVERIEGDDEFVQVRLRNRNLVRLSLDIVTLSLVGHEDGHQVFKAVIDG